VLFLISSPTLRKEAYKFKLDYISRKITYILTAYIHGISLFKSWGLYYESY